MIKSGRDRQRFDKWIIFFQQKDVKYTYLSDSTVIQGWTFIV